MKRIYIYKYLSLVLLILNISACSDSFLDLKPLGTLVNDNFWTSEKDATMGVMGCYDILQQTWLYNGTHEYLSMTVHMDGATDNAVERWAWQPLVNFTKNNNAPGTWMYQEFWFANYKGIARCNETIKNISAMDATKIDPIKAKELLAEVKFIRGLLYSNMVNLYNDIPLVTDVQSPKDEPAKVSRAEIVSFIQNDLVSCIDDLPESRPHTEWGRATKGAVYTLLARLNLFNIDNGGTYAKAAEYAKKIMDLDVYNLYPNYEKLFKFENEVNNEVIFPVTFERGPDDEGSSFVGWFKPPTPGLHWLYPLTNLADDYYCLNGKPIKDPVTGMQNTQYNPNNIWENRDPRMAGTIVGEGALWDGQVITKAMMSAEPTKFALRKWRLETSLDSRWDCDQDFYVFRFGHVLLMRAEALIMSGDIANPDINLCINALRDRVGMPDVESAEANGVNLTQDDYIKIIRHEWRVETAFEGWRYFNLIRWGQFEAAWQKVNETDHVKFPSVVPQHVYTPRVTVFPIPQSELDRNSNLVQNDLWK